MQIEEGQTIRVESQSVAYIKLMKNTRGYNWEIKQLSLDIPEIVKLNDEMIQMFNDKDGN